MTENEIALVNLAHGIVAGRVPLVEGVRRICDLSQSIGVGDDEIFHPFLSFEDETLTHPVGDVRARWSETALQRADSVLEGRILEAKDDLLRGCDAIIRRYSRPS